MQLEFLPDDPINKQYGWKLEREIRNGIPVNKIKTDYLSKATGEKGILPQVIDDKTGLQMNPKIIYAFDGTTLSYKDVKVACKVYATEPMVEKITNIAEITKIADKAGKTVTDRDSTPANINLPTNAELPTYKDDEITKSYVPGQQDDDDFEKLIFVEKKADLALKKFIVMVDGANVPSRLINVNTDPLKAG